MTQTNPENTAKKTVFLFHGENNYSSAQKVKTWKEAFINKYGEDANIEILEGKKLDIVQFNTNIESIPFLSEKKLIIVKDFLAFAKAEEQQQIAKSIERTPDFTVIVFHENKSADKRTSIYKKIAKIGTVEEFAEASPIEIFRWISNRAKKEGINISPQTTTYLSNYGKPDLWSVSNSLEKLKTYANGKEITNEMVELLVIPSITASIFKLSDCITEKRPTEAIKILNILQENGEELSRIFFMIVRHFRIMIQVKDMLERNENHLSISKRLNIPPFVVQNNSKICKNFKQKQLEDIYKRLLQIDIDLKTGGIKIYQGDNRAHKLAIEKFIIDCCR